MGRSSLCPALCRLPGAARLEFPPLEPPVAGLSPAQKDVRKEPGFSHRMVWFLLLIFLFKRTSCLTVTYIKCKAKDPRSWWKQAETRWDFWVIGRLGDRAICWHRTRTASRELCWEQLSCWERLWLPSTLPTNVTALKLSLQAASYLVLISDLAELFPVAELFTVKKDKSLTINLSFIQKLYGMFDLGLVLP